MDIIRRIQIIGKTQGFDHELPSSLDLTNYKHLSSSQSPGDQHQYTQYQYPPSPPGQLQGRAEVFFLLVLLSPVQHSVQAVPALQPDSFPVQGILAGNSCVPVPFQQQVSSPAYKSRVRMVTYGPTGQDQQPLSAMGVLQILPRLHPDPSATVQYRPALQMAIQCCLPVCALPYGAGA